MSVYPRTRVPEVKPYLEVKPHFVRAPQEQRRSLLSFIIHPSCPPVAGPVE